MTDQQKEEEAMFKHTFNFYLQQKGGVPLERYELPMILDGKSASTRTWPGLFFFTLANISPAGISNVQPVATACLMTCSCACRNT